MPIPWHYESETFRVRKFCAGNWENNVYVVQCTATNQAVIIDAAAEPDRVLAEAADVEPLSILTTHGHHDHVGAAEDVRTALGIPFRLHPADVPLSGIEPDLPLATETIEVGKLTVEAIHTPGHTLGSISFVLPGIVFTGDTLFPGGAGATRSPGSSFIEILDSIERHLFTLPGPTLVMPGHGLDTTIETEAPHLETWRARGW